MAEKIIEKDACHEFAWITDACIRDNDISMRQIQEIKHYFENISRGDIVLADLAMIIASPYALHTLIRNIQTTLIEVVQSMKIPKENKKLVYLSELLEFGLSANAIVSKQKFIFPRVNRTFLAEFYPLLASEILSCEEQEDDMQEDSDSEANEERSKKKEEDAHKPFPEKFTNYFLTSPTARKVRKKTFQF